MLANYTTNPISRVDKTRTCSITASQMQGANQLPYYSIFAESIVLETNTLLRYSLFSRQDYHLDSLLSNIPKSLTIHVLLFLLRRSEVPTLKHFTAPIVFKTSPSPTELLLH